MPKPKRQLVAMPALDGSTFLADPGYSEYHKNKRPVTTWLSKEDYSLFCLIAQQHGVTVAVYLRAIVIDALAEEGPKVKTVFTTAAADF